MYKIFCKSFNFLCVWMTGEFSVLPLKRTEEWWCACQLFSFTTAPPETFNVWKNFCNFHKYLGNYFPRIQDLRWTFTRLPSKETLDGLCNMYNMYINTLLIEDRIEFAWNHDWTLDLALWSVCKVEDQRLQRW